MLFINNEDGIALITALMLLVLLTLLGMSATTTSVLEIQIAGNDRDYKKNLYMAESAAVHAAVSLENADPLEITGTWSGNLWINTDSAQNWQQQDTFYMNDVIDYWDACANDANHTPPDPNYPTPSELPAGAFQSPPLYAAVYLGEDPFGTQDENALQKKHIWAIYGYSNENNARALVELGYGKWMQGQ